MQRDMDHSEAVPTPDSGARRQIEHHREVGDAARFGQQFRVAGIVVPGRVERRLAEWGSDDRIDVAFDCQFYRRSHGLIGGLARPCIDAACWHVEHAVVARSQAGERLRVGLPVDRVKLTLGPPRKLQSLNAIVWPPAAESPDARAPAGTLVRGSTDPPRLRQSPLVRPRPDRPSSRQYAVYRWQSWVGRAGGCIGKRFWLRWLILSLTIPPT